MRRGFTLLELIVVIIIIGILGTLGFTQYTKVVEKGRTAEAKAILGSMRTAWQSLYLEYGTTDPAMDDLAVEAPATSCVGTHYFVYSTLGTTGTATRCDSGAGGKAPDGPSAYTITLEYDAGTWGGTAGYY